MGISWRPVQTDAPWSRRIDIAGRRVRKGRRGNLSIKGSSSELREAVADRPILFRGLENVHEHVLGPRYSSTRWSR
jgi:hypothetical protein